MSHDPSLIEVRNATFGYAPNRPVVKVDRLALRRGRCVGIFGPNGAGKTTLVRGITGLLSPLTGEVVRGGAEALRYADPPLRFGYLPQHRAMELHWPMTGFDAAALATSARKPLGRIGGRDAGNIRAAMRRLDVEPLATRPFARLSGGQQQRLLLAGALAAEPQILVLDEPTDGLDVQSTHALLSLLVELTREGGLSTAIISHEIEDLLQVCDEVAWLHAAEAAGGASEVEMVTPQELAQRMTSIRRGA